MAANEIYDIVFVGKDYSPVEDAEKNFDSQNIKYDPNDILSQFLEEVTDENGICKPEFIVGSSAKKQRKFPLYKWYESVRYFQGVVGVLKKEITMKNEDENETQKFRVVLQIHSRFDVQNDQRYAKPYFLCSMLLSNKLKIHDNNVPVNEDEIFDYLMLFWFREKLREAARKGYYKTYRRFEKNDDRIKGVIDVSRHIKLNMGQSNGKIAYSYRENTENNYLNMLIVAAYRSLKKRYPDLVIENFDVDRDLKETIDHLFFETNFTEGNTAFLISRNLRPIAHPYFTEYEQLRVICLKILRTEGISIFGDNFEHDQETMGILFYIPDLWEEFLYEKVIEKALVSPITCKAQYKIMTFGYRDEEEKVTYKHETYPDYVFFHNEKPFLILDAKFKPRWAEQIFQKHALGDSLLEDYNKCLRDMVTSGTHATGVIFPVNAKQLEDIYDTVYIKHPISEYNKTDVFYTIPVEIPLAESEECYSDWGKNLENNLRKAVKKIKEITEESKGVE